MPQETRRLHLKFTFVLRLLVAGLCVAMTSVAMTSAARAASPKNETWDQYLNSHVGSTCTLSNEITIPGDSVTSSSTITSSIAQRLNAIRYNKSGHVYEFSLTTAATTTPDDGTNTAPTTIAYPLEVLKNGDLGVATTFGSLGSGIKWVIKGQMLYPSIAMLKSGRSVRSTLTISAYGTTPAAKTQIKQLITSGNALVISASYLVSSAPPRTSITTPSGTYTSIVGVHLRSPEIRVINGDPSQSAALNAVFNALAGNGYDLYFAKGVGEVSTTASGFVLNLNSCRG